MAVTERVPARPVAYKRRPQEFRSSAMSQVAPDRVASIMLRAEAGELEEWIELTDKMLDTDEHLASVVQTRIGAVLAARWEVEPGLPEGHTDRGLAEDAAEFCREQMEALPDLERLFSDLLHGNFTGLGALEHDWSYRGGLWLTEPAYRWPGLFRYWHDWRLQVRGPDRQWIDLPRDKFIVHTPRSRSTIPTRAALLRSVAWSWVFKYWAMYYWTIGAERGGNPFPIGKVVPNADDRVRKEMEDSLQALQAESFAVVEEGGSIEFLAPPFAGSAEVWKGLVAKCEAGMSKAIIGSTLNVEVGDTGGNRAAAESQADTTILPRAEQDGRALATPWERDFFGPLLRFNKGRFGDRVPPTPHLKFIHRESQPEVDELVLQSGKVKVDQLLQSRGLPPLGPNAGGEQFVTVDVPAVVGPAQAPGNFAASAAPGEDRDLSADQVSALKGILVDVSAGHIPRESGVELILASFPAIPRERAEAMLGVAQKGDASASGVAPPAPFSRRPPKRGRNRAPWQPTLPLTSRTSSTSRSPISDALSYRSDDPQSLPSARRTKR